MGNALVGEACAGVEEWGAEAVLVDWTRGGAEPRPIRQAIEMNKTRTSRLAAKNRLGVFIGNRIISAFEAKPWDDWAARVQYLISRTPRGWK